MVPLASVHHALWLSLYSPTFFAKASACSHAHLACAGDVEVGRELINKGREHAELAADARSRANAGAYHAHNIGIINRFKVGPNVCVIYSKSRLVSAYPMRS